MNFKKFCQDYAEEIQGEFREYDDTRSIIIIRLGDDRFQAVQGHVFTHEKYKQEVLQLKSKVCTEKDPILFRKILEASTEFVHAKFIMEDGFLKVEASGFTKNLNDGQIKEMIQEVGQLADEWELKITGKDIH
jgi:hypothetical protein